MARRSSAENPPPGSGECRAATGISPICGQQPTLVHDITHRSLDRSVWVHMFMHSFEWLAHRMVW
jgi:hypothetical protein